MPDTILDDVQALLDKELGDKRILEQILRAAQNNEVISNFERNYVRKLAEKHLGKKPAMEKKPEEPKIIPDVQIPTPPPQPKPVQTFSPPPKVSKSNSKSSPNLIELTECVSTNVLTLTFEMNTMLSFFITSFLMN